MTWNLCPTDYHVHFAWHAWRGQLSPGFKFNEPKNFPGGKSKQKHVDKRILGRKGFAVRRPNKHIFCPAGVCVYIYIYSIYVF